jgi:hypothetical protein
MRKKERQKTEIGYSTCSHNTLRGFCGRIDGRDFRVPTVDLRTRTYAMQRRLPSESHATAGSFGNSPRGEYSTLRCSASGF